MQNLDDALTAVAAQANSTLPKKEHFHLRLTCSDTPPCEKAVEKNIRYAMKLSGHSRTKCIWRYAEPGQGEFNEAVEGLHD